MLKRKVIVIDCMKPLFSLIVKLSIPLCSFLLDRSGGQHSNYIPGLLSINGFYLSTCLIFKILNLIRLFLIRWKRKCVGVHVNISFLNCFGILI